MHDAQAAFTWDAHNSCLIWTDVVDAFYLFFSPCFWKKEKKMQPPWEDAVFTCPYWLDLHLIWSYTLY